MGWLSMAAMIVKLIGIAEEVYKGISGKGSVKKASVVAATKEIVSDMVTVSTGGQKETWESISPLVDTFIDAAVGVSNLVSPGSVTDEDFEKAKAGILP